MFTKKMLDSVILLCTTLILYSTPNVTATSTPLFLTPYLLRNEIATAKELSLVNDSEGIIPRSYAGYLTVNLYARSNKNLFFWFFPTLNSNSSAPLLIWLNGGPGESSMIGLLLENGPIQLGKSSSGETIYVKRNNSWVDKFSMLYIDNPAQAGYSYSENLFEGGIVTQAEISGDLYEFVGQFYQIFSEFKQNDLYIGGQSYAGKYVPSFALRVHQEITNGNSQIRLRGIYLGGPLLDPSIQLLELFDLYYNLGWITNRELGEFKRNWTERFPVLVEKEIFYHYELMFEHTNDNFHKDDNPYHEEITAVMTSDKMRSLLHVGNKQFRVYDNITAYYVTVNDFKIPSVSQLSQLMNTYKVLIFGGDHDGLVSASGLEAVIMSLQWSSQSAYNGSKRLKWVENLNDTSSLLKGFYTRVSNFCRVVVKGSGHRTGITQPRNTLEMMEKFVAKGCLD